MIAQFTAMYRNAHRSQEEQDEGTVWEIGDFMPNWLAEERTAETLDPVAQMERDLAWVEMANTLFGGTDLRSQKVSDGN